MGMRRHNKYSRAMMKDLRRELVRARCAGPADREDMRLAEELAGAIVRILKRKGRTKG
jgi:hypothetical protein